MTRSTISARPTTSRVLAMTGMAGLSVAGAMAASGPGTVGRVAGSWAERRRASRWSPAGRGSGGWRRDGRPAGPSPAAGDASVSGATGRLGRRRRRAGLRHRGRPADAAADALATSRPRYARCGSVAAPSTGCAAVARPPPRRRAWAPTGPGRQGRRRRTVRSPTRPRPWRVAGGRPGWPAAGPRGRPRRAPRPAARRAGSGARRRPPARPASRPAGARPPARA